MDASQEAPREDRGLTLEKVIGGLVIIGLGLSAIVGSLSYPLGTMRSIGPGYFPLGLGILIVLLGLAFLWEARLTARFAGPVALRGLIAVAAAMAAFGLLIERAGAFAAVVALVGIAGLAEPHYRIVPTAVVAAGLCVFLAVVAWLAGPALSIRLI